MFPLAIITSLPQQTMIMTILFAVLVSYVSSTQNYLAQPLTLQSAPLIYLILKYLFNQESNMAELVLPH